MHTTARQRMNQRRMQERRKLTAGKAKLQAARRLLLTAAETLKTAEADLQGGKVIDLDLPEIIAQIDEMAGLLTQSADHAGRNAEGLKPL